jgi:hypothetical protein
VPFDFRPLPGLPFSPFSSFALLLRPLAPRALPRFFATTASADFSLALTKEISPGKVQNLSPRAARLYRMRLRMTLWLRCCQPARRPHPASLPFRIPTVESLLRASFSFTSRLRLAFRYGCRHRLRLAPLIQQDSAHAGHTGASTLACRMALLPTPGLPHLTSVGPTSRCWSRTPSGCSHSCPVCVVPQTDIKSKNLCIPYGDQPLTTYCIYCRVAGCGVLFASPQAVTLDNNISYVVKSDTDKCVVHSKTFSRTVVRISPVDSANEGGSQLNPKLSE